jgi:hypothetical protein
MPRFNGTLVDEAPAAAGPRFKGEPVMHQGQHLTFEEGQRLLDQEAAGGANGKTGAFLSGAVEGIPLAGPAIMGGIKRAAAGISSMIDGESYDTNLQQAQQITQDAQEQNPKTTIAGNVTGAVVGSLPMMEAAPAAFGMGNGTVAARTATSILGQVPLGAADGYIRNGQEGAMWGAGAGLVAGALGPAIGNAASSAYRGVMGNRALSEAAQAAGTSRPAVEVVARALGADNAAAGATNANIAAAGPRAMLADAGPSTLSVLDTAVQRGGPQAGEAAQRVGARAAGATDDINAALDAGLGPAQGMVRPLEELRTASQPARAAAYDAAYSTPINYADPRGQALEQMVRNRVPASVINRANNLMRVNGEQSRQIMANVAEDGTVTFETLPDVRQLDYITRALNDVSRAGDGAGALGGNTAEGRAYGGLAREIRNVLGGLVPEYRTALNTAAEPIAQREATLFGQRILSPTVARDEVEGFVAGMSDAELRSLRGGIRSQISESLANVKRAVSDPNVDARQGIAALRDLSSDAARQKLATVMGQREADAMLRTIDEAARSFEVRAGVATNSRTYARQAAERSVGQATGSGVLEKAAQGKPLATVQGFLANLFGAGEAAQLARQDAAWGDIANILTQPAGQAGGTFLSAMQGAAGRLPVIDSNAARLAAGVTRGNAIASRPFGQQLESR